MSSSLNPTPDDSAYSSRALFGRAITLKALPTIPFENPKASLKAAWIELWRPRTAGCDGVQRTSAQEYVQTRIGLHTILHIECKDSPGIIPQVWTVTSRRFTDAGRLIHGRLYFTESLSTWTRVGDLESSRHLLRPRLQMQQIGGGSRGTIDLAKRVSDLQSCYLRVRVGLGNEVRCIAGFPRSSPQPAAAEAYDVQIFKAELFILLSSCIALLDAGETCRDAVLRGLEGEANATVESLRLC